jgi:hypothetical protein
MVIMKVHVAQRVEESLLTHATSFIARRASRRFFTFLGIFVKLL